MWRRKLGLWHLRELRRIHHWELWWWHHVWRWCLHKLIVNRWEHWLLSLMHFLLEQEHLLWNTCVNVLLVLNQLRVVNWRSWLLLLLRHHKWLGLGLVWVQTQEHWVLHWHEGHLGKLLPHGWHEVVVLHHHHLLLEGVRGLLRSLGLWICLLFLCGNLFSLFLLD